MSEKFRKTSLYFLPTESYWKAVKERSDQADVKGLPGPYPLNMWQRICEGHFPAFDAEGIPLWPDGTTGNYIYFITTMSAFALGQWEQFLFTQEEQYSNRFLKIAERLVAFSCREGNGIALRNIHANDGSRGKLSAMNQGQGISVLLRAWKLTGDDKYMAVAEGCRILFERDMDNNGVVGQISELGIPWFEEYPEYPLNHVLNGMIFALWGLYELFVMAENKKSGTLFFTGVESVAKALPLFDTGFWSYYWLPEPGNTPYVASMMYHNLHIVQLKILAEMSSNEVVDLWSDRFRTYAGSVLNRLRAALAIFQAKRNLRKSAV